MRSKTMKVSPVFDEFVKDMTKKFRMPGTDITEIIGHVGRGDPINLIPLARKYRGKKNVWQ